MTPILSRIVATLALAAATQSSHVGVSLGPTASWIVPIDAGEPSSAESAVGADGVERILVDDQVRIGPETREDFHRRVYRVSNEKAIRDASHFTAEFDPSYQTVVLHAVALRRRGETASRLSEAGLHVLQHESGLEEHVYDQRMSVVLFLDDVRVGDVIETSYTVRGENPVFAGRFAAHVAQGWSVPVRRCFFRIVAPVDRGLKLRSRGGGQELAVARKDAEQEYLWDARDVPAVLVEPGIPAWFDPYPACDVSEYSDWAEVARWGQGIFRLVDPVSPELQARIADLARSGSAPADRIDAAIALVRDEVRYLGLEFGAGSNRPSPPDQVFQRRFGDCKDKALLLATLLRGLGVDAKPALVHSRAGAALGSRLPSPLVFDHVIVRLNVDGRTYWIDPTLLYARGALDRRASPRYGSALVLDEGTVELTPIAPASDDVPETRIETSVITAEPEKEAEMTVSSTYSRESADRMRARIAENGRAATEKGFLNELARSYPSIRSAGPLEVQDDTQADVLETTERYAIPGFWEHLPGGKRIAASFSAREIVTAAAAPSTSIRTMPLGLPFPFRVISHTRAVLPGTWKLAPDHQTAENEAFRFAFDASFSGSELDLAYRYETLCDHVPPENVRAHAERLGRVRETTKYRVARAIPGKDAEARAESLTEVNGGVLGFAILSGIIAVGGCLALYLRRPRAPPVVPAQLVSELEGFGGWLLLSAIGVVITPLTIFPTTYRLILTVGGPNWETLTRSGSTGYRAIWAPFLLGEVFGNICLSALSILLVLLMVEKRRRFPATFIAVRLAGCALMAADHYVAGFVRESENPAALAKVVITVAFTIPWVLYFLRSRRVKATFVH